jgi:AcrR family transcriptional regulator
MPKLKPETLARRRRRIEDAARELFCSRGFHGVGLRDICQAAKVSVGNVYNHFESKDAIYRSLVERLYADFMGPATPLARYLATTRFPDDLEALAAAIRAMLREHRSYILLVFVDAVELSGQHIRRHYEDLTGRFRGVLGPRIPALAFAAVYMQFFNYFIVRDVFGVENHLGPSDEAVVRELARLFRDGLPPRKQKKK